MVRFINKKLLTVAKRFDCCVGQFWPNVTGRLFLGHYMLIFDHCGVIGLQSYRIH